MLYVCGIKGISGLIDDMQFPKSTTVKIKLLRVIYVASNNWLILIHLTFLKKKPYISFNFLCIGYKSIMESTEIENDVKSEIEMESTEIENGVKSEIEMESTEIENGVKSEIEMFDDLRLLLSTGKYPSPGYDKHAKRALRKKSK